MKKSKQNAYQDLRYRVITHDLKPGEQLNERSLMTHYDIGRTPLREVLIALQRDGLIQRFPRSGTFVAPLDFHFFKQVVEIRIQLESYAAQMATRRITQSQLNTLRQILKQVDTMKNEGERNLEVLTHREFEFHDTLIEATHNPKLIEILHELHGISARFWHYLVFGRQELLDQFIDLKKIFNAVEKGKADQARDAMEKHIQNFVEKIRDRIV